MIVDKDKIIFSSGRSRPANCGIIGINDKLVVTEGYDGPIFDEETDAEFMEEPLSQGDLLELADFMLGRWQQFKTKHEQG